MNIKECFSSDNKSHWINKMEKCDWGAGQWLAELLMQKINFSSVKLNKRSSKAPELNTYNS